MDKISPIKERILLYIDYKGVTKLDFCEKTSISYANLKGKGLKSEIGGQQIGKILSIYNDISPEWLLTGAGQMLKGENIVPEPHKEKRLIPLFDDVTTIGGCNSISASVDGCMPHNEYIDAGDWFHEACAAIRHYGDSMVEYPSGCILAIKKVEDLRLILWGHNYVVETDEFRITKRLQKGADDSTIVAYSSNTETYPDGRQIHEPKVIPLDTVRSIWLVLGYVVKEFSSGAVFIQK